MKSCQILVLSLIVLVCYGSKFNIASVSTCTSTSAAGFCTKWEQTGTVDEQTAACFSGYTVVMTKSGFKTLSELQIGDQILSYDRSAGQIYTELRGWFHKDTESQVEYLQMTFQNDQTLLVSEKHNIAFKGQSSDFQFMFAEEMNQENQLFGQQNAVKSVRRIKQAGMYAPMTYNNNYFVFTSMNANRHKILAHDFANIKNPEAYQTIQNMILSGYELLHGKTAQSGIHPAASWMMKKFDFLLE